MSHKITTIQLSTDLKQNLSIPQFSSVLSIEQEHGIIRLVILSDEKEFTVDKVLLLVKEFDVIEKAYSMASYVGSVIIDNIKYYALLKIAIPSDRRVVEAARVIDVVSGTTNIPVEDMVSPSRKRQISESRNIAMKLIKDRTHLSLKKIGEIFHRDHSTVINSIDVVIDLYTTDKGFREKFEKIKSLLN